MAFSRPDIVENALKRIIEIVPSLKDMVNKPDQPLHIIEYIDKDEVKINFCGNTIFYSTVTSSMWIKCWKDVLGKWQESQKVQSPIGIEGEEVSTGELFEITRGEFTGKIVRANELSFEENQFISTMSGSIHKRILLRIADGYQSAVGISRAVKAISLWNQKQPDRNRITLTKEIVLIGVGKGENRKEFSQKDLDIEVFAGTICPKYPTKEV